ncbi:MAG: prepilin-type N-terminal cleavage/methylation domain-containing protein [Candidatus Edwardsbacteria bacterium]|nr:prepilin-type N-terminal cleavage/methylation domain-containing protein [Candidatus Edwardsbacteria bacterium]MBU1577550.1 prepilin-type N-terminal cleavage/methylation domain-containing protein [Candidatus Edwardsbacteria bacterium]MBU2462512.1 prepilin-type N-terminal cleavage/methylation domain-containing protein [Candidatus Edwardsbacteria bacterium]MBU2593645.1 prepilin-type N-terminal cleavage/methylation domain-containing protein [Candidatus Edwardsbacteria bacterium]
MNKHGMSLVELMVSITILSITLLGIAALFPRGMGHTTQSRLLTQATNLAMEKSEEFERMPATHADLTLGAHQETVDGFTRDWVITNENITTKIKRAVITVTWVAGASTMNSIGTTVFLYKP